ncbi:MAG: glycoside hydrolase 15-like protein [Candidatus Saccharibacteria bacterium]|nr:glycoside hydrolase 15-like protein [Candidatus Saccharibacteria bacterium]
MGRPVMLGNGSLTVGLNEHGLVHDFYYPYVGLDNLTTARSVHHMIGVWVNDQFSWVDDGSWQTVVDFEEDALISTITMKHEGMQVRLELKDFVDNEYNVFCRQISVHNDSEEQRNIRLFMHQVFEISRNGRADTALFVPDEHYLLDYKGRCSLLIYGQTADGIPYDQFAVGNYGIEGKAGTYMDAQDGELSNNAVEHGGVDSIIRFSLDIPAGEATTVEYYIAAGDSQHAVEKLHTIFKKGLAGRLEKARTHWHGWLSISKDRMEGIDEQYIGLAKKSLLLIKAHIDKRGGIIASCDSSIYNFGRDYYSYVWPRDGAYAMWPLIRLGYTEEPKKFFEFCRDILTTDGYLMHKYQPDKAVGSTWHPLLHAGNRPELPIQEDETAIVIYMLGEYYGYSKDAEFVSQLYLTLIQPACNFMADFMDEKTNLPHASYDLWEEKFLTNSYTAALTHGALQVAADFAELFEYPDDAVKWREAAAKIVKNFHVFYDHERKLIRKGYLLGDEGLQFDGTLDISSLYAAFTFGNVAEWETFINDTAEAVENTLLDQTPSGGSPRYEHDNYFAAEPPYLGNPWFVTTLWVAQYYLAIDEVDKAEALIKWTMERALPSGALSEQVNPTDSSPVSVLPLVWSHAEFVNTVLDLSKR